MPRPPKSTTISHAAPQQTTIAPPRVDRYGGDCPACGSGRHSDFFGSIKRDAAGEYPPGVPFVAVTMHRATCLDCGQQFVVRHYHRLGAPEPAAV